MPRPAQRPTKTPHSIVIIGAGVAGLSAAARLAKSGHSVQVFEASDRTGGKCRRENIEGFIFDTGPSLFTLPAVYKDLFLKTGKRLESELNVIATDPSFRYHFADGKSVEMINLDLPRTCASIDNALGKEAGDAWHALMQRAEAMWDISRNPFISGPAPTMRSLLRASERGNRIRDFKLIAPFTTLRGISQSYSNNPYIQKIVDRYATYTGSDPRKAPASLLTIPFIETSFGAWHIEGGVGLLAEKLEERARALGVTFHLNTPVASITTENGKATGVVTRSGEVHLAEIVIANADPAIVYGKLLDRKARGASRERKKVQKREASLAGFVLLLGLDNSKVAGDLPKLAHHNIYFPEDYDKEFNQIFDANIPVEDPTIYICAPQDSTMVPNSHSESWFVLVNAPIHDPAKGCDWSTIKEEYGEKIIEKLDRLGLRVSERLVVKEFRSPLDLAHQVSAPGGAIYGGALHGARSVFKKSKNKSGVENLYLLGGGTHPGGGLPLVGLSAELVVDDINGTQPGESFH